MIGRDCYPPACWIASRARTTSAAVEEAAVGIGVIGVGLMGAHHAANLAGRVHGARLVGLADPELGVAERNAADRRCPSWTRD